MILHADFSTGVSGDKLLGALLELCEHCGVAGLSDLETVAATLLPGITVQRERVIKSGIGASQMHIHEQDPPSRNWQQIREMIATAAGTGTLSDNAAKLAVAVFSDIASAEARVHGVSIDHVHFHEIGAADSIIDIVGCCYLLDKLAPTRFYATPLALGNGTIKCDHGELAVPAPATVQLIKGLPVFASEHLGELTTPTGAALAANFITNWEPLPCMRPTMVGFGAGTMNLPGAANVVRVIAGEPTELSGSSDDLCQDKGLEDGFTVQGCTLLETNIDHLTPEALAFICEELLKEGA